MGADNWALEVVPFETPDNAFVVHQHLLAETGIYIIEIDTAELVVCDRSEFLFVMTPLKIKAPRHPWCRPWRSSDMGRRYERVGTRASAYCKRGCWRADTETERVRRGGSS